MISVRPFEHRLRGKVASVRGEYLARQHLIPAKKGQLLERVRLWNEMLPDFSLTQLIDN
jgi:hypothetical protein